MTNEEVVTEFEKALLSDAAIEISDRALRAAIEVLRSQKTGSWERMSELPEDIDERYECSCCGNVVHCKNRLSLFIFHQWCGRCGSHNVLRSSNKLDQEEAICWIKNNLLNRDLIAFCNKDKEALNTVVKVLEAQRKEK